MRIFFLTALISLIPAIAHGIEDFVPLAPIPGLTDGDLYQGDNALIDYVNNVFQFAIIIGAGLAVIRLIIAGFQYMTTEAVGEKKDSRAVITGAIIGVILLLSVTLILQTINPQIINLNALNFGELNIGTNPNTSGNNQPSDQYLERNEEEWVYWELYSDGTVSINKFSNQEQCQRALDSEIQTDYISYTGCQGR